VEAVEKIRSKTASLKLESISMTLPQMPGSRSQSSLIVKLSKKDSAASILFISTPFSLYNLMPLRIASAMPSFDIVSQVNPMEIENAVNQSRKELANRFDFKGSTAEIVLEKNEIKLTAEDQFKIKALVEIVIGKLAKRSISLKSVDKGQPDLSPLGHARQVIKIKQGIETTVAKQITGYIREGKFKVTTQIQGEEIRVTSKSKDELQTVMAAIRAQDFPVAVSFQNFRD